MPPFHGQPQLYFSEMILINYLMDVFLNVKRKYCQSSSSSSVTNVYCLLCIKQCVTCCTYIIHLSPQQPCDVGNSLSN